MLVPMEGIRLGESHYRDAAMLAEGVADVLGRIIDRAVRERGRAVLALAGGGTPMPAYRLLAAQSCDWRRVILLPTDERWVDAGHPARNDRAMAEAMQQATGVQIRSLVGSRAEGVPTTAVAEQSLADLGELFDGVLLGMGLDSHTASLFPRTQATQIAWEGAAPAYVVTPEPLPAEAPFPRITLGRMRLRQTRALHLMISGEAKLRVLEQARAEEPTCQRPISGFLARGGRAIVHWSP